MLADVCLSEFATTEATLLETWPQDDVALAKGEMYFVQEYMALIAKDEVVRIFA